MRVQKKVVYGQLQLFSLLHRDMVETKGKGVEYKTSQREKEIARIDCAAQSQHSVLSLLIPGLTTAFCPSGAFPGDTAVRELVPPRGCL